MTSEEVLNEIKTIMGGVLLSANGKDGNFRPIKWTTRQQCYNVLGKIQTLLGTNKVEIPQGGIVGGEKREMRGEMVRQMNEREMELFVKFYHGATTGDWLNLRRSLNDEIEELIKNSNTKEMTRNEEIEKAYEDRDDIKDYSLAEYGFKEGADWQKQVLMQYAVDGVVRDGICGQYLDCDKHNLQRHWEDTMPTTK